MRLSKRLASVADMVTEGSIIADIGTDHGFLPIELVKSGKCPSGFAMDIRQGPLDRAISHIDEEGLNDKIICRLSNGFEKLAMDEAGTAVIAGMGGDIIADIILSKPGITKELVVSPHTHPELVRKALHTAGYRIVDENMVNDAGKNYVIIKANRGKGSELYSDVEYLFGKILIRKKHPILREMLENEIDKFKDITQKKEYIDTVHIALELMR